MQEKTFFMIKPDGVGRGLIDEIIARIEKNNLKVINKKQLRMTKELAADLYSPHLDKKFYPGLIDFITSGPVICSIIEGENAIAQVRQIMGATDPRQAASGSIRGDLKEENVLTPMGTIKNLVHGSDSPESAGREMAIFFKEDKE